MGTEIYLVWDGSSKEEKDAYIFKCSTYPWDKEFYKCFPNYEQYDFRGLKFIYKWLMKFQWILQIAPESLKYIQNAWYDRAEEYLKFIGEDIKRTKKAYYKAKILELEGKNPKIELV